ncbi:seipin-like isoform X1 [Nerophis ophidion]|uniref:seipin-like isoform X1 n=1 Tax=Nerophis ophidion TaxID=159077 RepID=UPI002ADF2188|nr:seipin-like isoform X1 [Nerophis ophidion]
MDHANYRHSGDDDEDDEPFLLFGAVLTKVKDAVDAVITRTLQRAVQGVVVFFVVVLLLWTAAFLYGSFYYSYMPLAAYSTPVHYYYRADCDSPSSFACSYPLANVSLMRNNKPVLTFGQAYRILLQLEMPDSHTNHDIGMFMIRTTSFSRAGGRVASSARSARQLLPTSSSRFSMLRYQSDLLRTISTLLFLPAFLSGVAEQKQVLEVELFAEYTEDPYSPSVKVVIEILSNKVQIYSSQLYIHAYFTGIRYLLFNYPVLSALVGVSSNFVFLGVLLVFSYVRLLLGVEWRPEQVQVNGADRVTSHSTRNGENDNSSGVAELPAGQAAGRPPGAQQIS